MLNSTTGVEDKDHWRNKILRALDELRDSERTVGAAQRRQWPLPEPSDGAE